MLRQKNCSLTTPDKLQILATPTKTFTKTYQMKDLVHSSKAGLGNVRHAGHIRPAKHFNVARELH